MENVKLCVFDTRTPKGRNYEVNDSRNYVCANSNGWRRQCGCIRTSEKLKEILQKFPAPPPPSPSTVGTLQGNQFDGTCISAYCTQKHHTPLSPITKVTEYKQCNATTATTELGIRTMVMSRSRQVIAEAVQLVHLSVTATALALYYLIYCYMQLVYYTLRTALYFHNADGPMKITIGVVTLTSLVIGFNLLMKIERLMGL